jgi:hypothetical protein
VTVAATANVLVRLPAADARAALGIVLERRPDVVLLQEWGLRRLGLLRETGSVRVVPVPGLRLPRRPPAPRAGGDHPAYTWVAPALGQCPVGLRGDRYDVLDARVRLLLGPGRNDPGAGEAIRPARIATVVTARDRRTDRRLAVVGYHLTAGVQARGHYRTDRPRVTAAHRRQWSALERLVADLVAEGHEVHAGGDSNFDGFRLPGLTSAWEGRPGHPGTLGHRRIDDVFGLGPADDVELLTTPSDHRAVLVTRTDARPVGGRW